MTIPARERRLDLSDEGLGSESTLENNASIVLKLTYGARSFLFMGAPRGRSTAMRPNIRSMSWRTIARVSGPTTFSSPESIAGQPDPGIMSSELPEGKSPSLSDDEA